MPLWTAEQKVYVLKLLGGNVWLNSSPEHEQSARLLYGTFRCKQFSPDGTEFHTTSTVSALEKNTKGKRFVQQIFVLYFPQLHLSCSWCPPAFHAISFTLSFPRSGELAAMTEQFIFAKVSHQVSSVGRHGRQLYVAKTVTDLRLGAQQVCSGTW